MIPVTWLPSPFKNLRDARYEIRGVVSHRIVGTLPSARSVFGVGTGTPRSVSSHFGIGYVNGKLTLDQYVDLSDMAWTNGDVREPTWAFYQPGVNPNLTTVTIEHEDGGSANRGKVSEEVWSLSMEVQKLVTSGDLAAIRAAGIRVRYAHHVDQLARIPKDTRGFIDHHQIAGPNKPYCFRRWLDDPGFVEGSPSRRDRLLAYLRDDMPTPKLSYVPQLWKARAGGAALREQANLDAPVITRVPEGGIIFTLGEASTTKEGWRLGVAGDPETLFYVYRPDIDPLPPTPRDAELHKGIATVVNARAAGNPVPIGGYTAEDLTEAQIIARRGTADKANAQMDAWTASRPKILP